MHVYQILTRTTYAGRHRLNTRDHKTKQPKPETEVVEMAVPAIVDPMEFAAVQERLRAQPEGGAAAGDERPILLTGICFCADCGSAMMLRSGKSGRFRYDTCGTAARVGKKRPTAASLLDQNRMRSAVPTNVVSSPRPVSSRKGPAKNRATVPATEKCPLNV